MTQAAWVRALGPQVAHVTAASNVPGILSLGLQPAAELARRSGTRRSIVLRDERTVLVGNDVSATLNHQKPILHGLRAARQVLDEHTPESWAAQLDGRVFFWPRTRGLGFQRSVARDVDLAVLWLATDRLLALCEDRLSACPINSGNFLQGGARANRGNWIYVPVADGMDAFRRNRMRRGLASSPDSVAELSITGGISADALRSLIDRIDMP